MFIFRGMVLFHHSNIRLFLDDLTHFKMMHSFQHFFLFQITGWDTNLVSKNNRGKAVFTLIGGRRVVWSLQGHCHLQMLLHSSRFVGTMSTMTQRSLTWFDWLMSVPDRPSAVGPTCFCRQALLLCAHH